MTTYIQNSKKSILVAFAAAFMLGLMLFTSQPAYAADVYDITFYHDSIYGEGEAGHLKGSSTKWDHPTWGSDTWVGSAKLRPKVYYEAGDDHFTLKVNISRVNGAHQPGGNYVSGTVKYNGHTITFKNWGPFGCGSDWVDIRFERTAITFNYNGGRNHTQGTNNISADYYWYNANNFSIVDTYNGKNFDIENQPYWTAYPPVSSDTIFGGWWTEPTGGTRITTEDITKLSGTMTLYAHWEPYYLVQLVGGTNVTPSRGYIDVEGHHTTQVVQGEEMEPVIFTANSGYHIDHNSIDDVMQRREGTDIHTQNGVTVERISDTQYVAFGTPTGQVHIWIPNGHKYEGWTTTTAATCTTAGAKERVCKYDATIKETATVPIDSNAHSYKFKDFTWTGDETSGYTAATANYVCEHDASHTTSADATISDEVTDPTCTDPGKTTYTATVAAADSPDGTEHTESKDANPTDPINHSYKFKDFTWTGDETSGYTAAKANYVCENDSKHTTTAEATISEDVLDPTCTEPGKTTYTATVAAADSPDGEEHTESKDAKAEDPLQHDWDEWEQTVAPTCSTVGEEKHVCKRDSSHFETREVAIDDNAHKWGDWTQTLAPTCSAVGTEERVCEHNSEHKETRNVDIDPKAHKWGEWIEKTPATETKEGEETRTCEYDASHTESRPIPKLDHVHKLSHVDAVAATCETDGNKEYWICSEGENPCGRYFADSEGATELNEEDTIVEALGHDWGEWTQTTAPTCTETGVETRTCNHDASHTETRDVEALGHDWGEWTQTTAPTCTETGVETRTCNHDASHTETRDVAALGHDWSEWTVTKEPTTEAEGEETRTCSRCGETEKRAVPKLDPEPDPEPKPDPEPDDEISYSNTEGDGTQWTKGSSATADFTFKRSTNDSETFSHFVGIQMDGADVDPSNYTAEAGSVIVKLKPAYLETLSAGEHTLTALFSDGNNPSAKFTILAKKTPAPASKTPTATTPTSGRQTARTADGTPATPAIALLALVAAAGVALARRRLV